MYMYFPHQDVGLWCKNKNEKKFIKRHSVRVGKGFSKGEEVHAMIKRLTGRLAAHSKKGDTYPFFSLSNTKRWCSAIIALTLFHRLAVPQSPLRRRMEKREALALIPRLLRPFSSLTASSTQELSKFALPLSKSSAGGYCEMQSPIVRARLTTPLILHSYFGDLSRAKRVLLPPGEAPNCCDTCSLLACAQPASMPIFSIRVKNARHPIAHVWIKQRSAAAVKGLCPTSVRRSRPDRSRKNEARPCEEAVCSRQT